MDRISEIEFQRLILKSLKTTTDRALAEKLSTSVTTIRRWMNGFVSPSPLGRMLIYKALRGDDELR